MNKPEQTHPELLMITLFILTEVKQERMIFFILHFGPSLIGYEKFREDIPIVLDDLMKMK